MTVKNPVKNQAYVAKHSKNLREQIGKEEYKKREAEARRLRRQKQKQTLPPVDMEALKDYTSLCLMDITNLIDLLPPPAAQVKAIEEATTKAQTHRRHH
jgi:hypothetical protein